MTIPLLMAARVSQRWNLELFQLAEPMVLDCDRPLRKIILVAEGNVNALDGTGGSIAFRSGEIGCIDPTITHSLVPLQSALFFSIDFLASDSDAEFLPPLDPNCFGERLDLGSYAVYELVTGQMTQEKWSAALLEIQDSPKHFHRIEKEIFVIVEGELDIEVDGAHQVLRVGESITISPNQVHQLKSSGKRAARVLCFSFPAFNPADMYRVI